MNPPNEQKRCTGDVATRKHLRGSSLMLIGRMLAVVVNFITQLVIVRALTKDDFGAFAYALSMLMIGSAFARLGMDKALSRFTPIYLEQGDKKRAAGIITFVLGSILILGSILALSVWLLQGHLSSWFHSGPMATQLLVFLAILAPIESLENALEKLLAIVARPRSLFFRRHLLGPLLKLSAALPILLLSGDVMGLAWLYLAARLVGLVVSGLMVAAALQKCGVARHCSRIKGLPAREVLGFSIPLLSTDVAYSLRTSFVAFFLEFYHTASAVAAYRAVVPVARLNLLVSDSFRLLYSPAAARLFARKDTAGLETLYWNNTAWISLLTFPVFILTFAFARPLVELMFGARYSGSGEVLCWLAVGSYINASFGFNAVTLRILGHVRVLVVNDLIGAAAAVGLNILLIPRYGALGGAMAFCIANIIQNVLLQIFMFRSGALRSVSPACLKVYASVGLTLLFVWMIQAVYGESLVIGVLLAAVGGWAVIRWNAKSLGISSVFPELQRIAPLRLVLGLRGEPSL